jgi:hypothetical protein
MRVMLDMDGVVADFYTAAAALHRLPLPNGGGGLEAWWLPTIWNMSASKFYDPMGYDFWRHMPKMPDADEIVVLLDGYFGIENICFLTSPVLTPGCMDGKRDWGREHYPEIPTLISVTARESKVPPKEFCAHPDTLLVDDMERNTDPFEKAGGKAYLLPRPWNRMHYVEDDPVTDLRNYIETLL